jgi:hypothetical protein
MSMYTEGCAYIHTCTSMYIHTQTVSQTPACARGQCAPAGRVRGRWWCGGRRRACCGRRWCCASAGWWWHPPPPPPMLPTMTLLCLLPPPPTPDAACRCALPRARAAVQPTPARAATPGASESTSGRGDDPSATERDVRRTVAVAGVLRSSSVAAGSATGASGCVQASPSVPGCVQPLCVQGGPGYTEATRARMVLRGVLAATSADPAAVATGSRASAGATAAAGTAVPPPPLPPLLLSEGCTGRASHLGQPQTHTQREREGGTMGSGPWGACF